MVSPFRCRRFVKPPPAASTFNRRVARGRKEGGEQYMAKSVGLNNPPSPFLNLSDGGLKEKRIFPGRLTRMGRSESRPLPGILKTQG